jgi:hypothetical protein
LAHAQRQIRYLKVALIGAVMTAIGLLVAGKLILDEVTIQRDLTRKGRENLERAQAELAQVRAELEAVVRGRLPLSRPMEYEKVLPIGEKYIKNVVFNQSQHGIQQACEYRIVLYNQEAMPIQPRVRILLFDRAGMQVGMAEVGQDGEGTDLRLHGLTPGEVRSYSGSIELMTPREPEFFMLKAN